MLYDLNVLLEVGSRHKLLLFRESLPPCLKLKQLLAILAPYRESPLKFLSIFSLLLVMLLSHLLLEQLRVVVILL